MAPSTAYDIHIRNAIKDIVNAYPVGFTFTPVDVSEKLFEQFDIILRPCHISLHLRHYKSVVVTQEPSRHTPTIFKRIRKVV